MRIIYFSDGKYRTPESILASEGFYRMKTIHAMDGGECKLKLWDGKWKVVSIQVVNVVLLKVQETVGAYFYTDEGLGLKSVQ